MITCVPLCMYVRFSRVYQKVNCIYLNFVICIRRFQCSITFYQMFQHNLFASSPGDGHLVCFWYGAFMNNACACLLGHMSTSCSGSGTSESLSVGIFMFTRSC